MSSPHAASVATTAAAVEIGLKTGGVARVQQHVPLTATYCCRKPRQNGAGGGTVNTDKRAPLLDRALMPGTAVLEKADAATKNHGIVTCVKGNPIPQGIHVPSAILDCFKEGQPFYVCAEKGCSYLGDRLYHAKLHCKRCHVEGGRPMPRKRKYGEDGVASGVSSRVQGGVSVKTKRGRPSMDEAQKKEKKTDFILCLETPCSSMAAGGLVPVEVVKSSLTGASIQRSECTAGGNVVVKQGVSAHMERSLEGITNNKSAKRDGPVRQRPNRKLCFDQRAQHDGPASAKQQQQQHKTGTEIQLELLPNPSFWDGEGSSNALKWAYVGEWNHSCSRVNEMVKAWNKKDQGNTKSVEADTGTGEHTATPVKAWHKKDQGSDTRVEADTGTGEHTATPSDGTFTPLDYQSGSFTTQLDEGPSSSDDRDACTWLIDTRDAWQSSPVVLDAHSLDLGSLADNWWDQLQN